MNSLEFQVSEKSARDELKSSMVSMASTTISYESSDCNNTSIEEMNISYESPASRVKLNLMEMLKEKNAFRGFKKRLQQKRRVYETEYGHNKD